MPALILPLIEAVTHWPERGALVGLDLGTKTIGVAVSNADRRLATGVETLHRKAFKADAGRLLAIAGERNVVGFILGLPINMDASEGPRAQSTRAFARNFAKLTDLPIALWDERLSTVAVDLPEPMMPSTITSFGQTLVNGAITATPAARLAGRARPAG